MVGARPDRADGRPDAGLGRRGAGPVQGGVQADQARRRRRAQDPLVAGRDAAQPALRRRHQGPGRLAHLLRAARLLGSRRQPLARPRRRDPDRAERRHRQGRQVGHLEAQEGRGLARRQALHRGRRASSTGSTWPTPRPRRPTSARYKDIKVEKVDSHTVRLVVPEADAVLGGRLLRRARHDHPQAPVRGLQGRQVARGADQPEAGGHGAVQVRGLQAGRHGRAASSTRPTTCPIARTSTPSR